MKRRMVWCKKGCKILFCTLESRHFSLRCTYFYDADGCSIRIDDDVIKSWRKKGVIKIRSNGQLRDEKRKRRRGRSGIDVIIFINDVVTSRVLDCAKFGFLGRYGIIARRLRR